ncbi:MAG: DNA repair protein RecO [Bacteroidales bacterium]|nr:DNA repair protein RecO [Bacteroidales bacterium]
MLVKTKGIVLNRRKYSDTSLIVKVFTRQCGVVSFIVKNAFSKNSRFSQAHFAPMNLLELTFHHKNNTSLQYIKELSFYRHYENIPFDLAKNTILLFYNELLYRLLFDYGADERLYDFIEHELIGLDSCEKLRPDAHIIFMATLARELGFLPDNNLSELTPYFAVDDGCFTSFPHSKEEGLDREASRYLSEILTTVSEGGTRHDNATPTKAVRNNVLDILVIYFERHNEQLHGLHSVEMFRKLAEILQQ